MDVFNMSKQIKIPRPKAVPDALECRRLLGDLEPVKEWRKANWWLLILYVAFPFFVMIYIAGPLVSNDILPDNVWGMLIFLAFFLGAGFLMMLGIDQEQKLDVLTHFDVYKKSLDHVLNAGEKILTVVRAREYSLDSPGWLDIEVEPDYFFFFTTDRLLIVSLYKDRYPKWRMFSSVMKKEGFGFLIKNIYSVSLTERFKVQIGGRFGPNVLSLFCTKIEVTPTSEEDSYTWLLYDKYTRNGKLLKKIQQRLHQGYGTEF